MKGNVGNMCSYLINFDRYSVRSRAIALYRFLVKLWTQSFVHDVQLTEPMKLSQVKKQIVTARDDSRFTDTATIYLTFFWSYKEEALSHRVTLKWLKCKEI